MICTQLGTQCRQIKFPACNVEELLWNDWEICACRKRFICTLDFVLPSQVCFLWLCPPPPVLCRGWFWQAWCRRWWGVWAREGRIEWASGWGWGWGGQGRPLCDLYVCYLSASTSSILYHFFSDSLMWGHYQGLSLSLKHLAVEKRKFCSLPCLWKCSDSVLSCL